MPHAVHLHLPHDSEGNVESTFAIWAPGYVYSVLATKHSKEFFFLIFHIFLVTFEVFMQQNSDGCLALHQFVF